MLLRQNDGLQCVCLLSAERRKAAPPKMLKFECDDRTHLKTTGLIDAAVGVAGLTAGRLLKPCVRLCIL